ncbi:hypothetical protein D929_02215 [Enterococcus faecalis 02-MB-P-10]|nr:hypothetical protein D929_02215 [Enterococcus faecalis 02-MB-P-10]
MSIGSYIISHHLQLVVFLSTIFRITRKQPPSPLKMLKIFS